jgi:hypothetical protein
MKWTGRVVRISKARDTYRILFRMPERKRPLGRPSRRWEHNIKTDLKKTGCEVVDWIHLAQDVVQWRALVNEVVNFKVMWGVFLD